MITGLTWKKVSGLLLAFLLLCSMICTLTNHWLVHGDEYQGLWKICSKHIGCLWMNTSPSYLIAFLDWYSAVRSFLVLTCIFIFVGIVCQCLNIWYEETFSMFLVRFINVFTGLFMILAIIIFTSMKSSIYDSTWQFGWSFYLLCSLPMVVTTETYISMAIIGKTHSNTEHSRSKRSDPNKESASAKHDTKSHPKNKGTAEKSKECFEFSVSHDNVTISRREYEEAHTVPPDSILNNNLTATQTTLLWERSSNHRSKNTSVEHIMNEQQKEGTPKLPPITPTGLNNTGTVKRFDGNGMKYDNNSSFSGSRSSLSEEKSLESSEDEHGMV